MDTKYINNKPSSKYKVDIEDYKIVKSIGQGSYGSVYIVENNQKQQFAAKILKKDESLSEKKNTNREISIMMHMNHPTLVEFQGYSLEDFNGEKNTTIFMNYYKNGSLSDQLSKCRLGLADPEFNNTARLIILIGVAYGMKYLHEHRIIHRDLKPANILLDSELRPHIIDFGLSKYVNTNIDKSCSSKCTGTPAYMAPEMFDNEYYNEKVDVYSFGILMYEVITDQIPFPNCQKMSPYQFLTKVKQNNLRPKFNFPVKKSMKELISKCWANDPKDRPTFDEIYNKLAYNNNNDNDMIIDIYNESEENNYFLDGADADEVRWYIDQIEEKSPIDELKFQIKSLQNQLKNHINNHSNNNDEILKKITKENNEMKAIISQLESIITIDGFNTIPLSSQKSVLSSAINNSTNQNTTNFLMKIENLISDYLSFDNPKINTNGHYFKINTNDFNKLLIKCKPDDQLYLFSNSTEILYYNNSFISTRFINLIQNFSKVCIEIEYPSDSYNAIYQQVVNLKESIKNETTIEISVHIKDINSVGNHFFNNSEINQVRIDSSNSIINDQYPGMFERCSNLNKIEIPSTISEIGNRSFAGSSINEIIIPSSVKFIGKHSFASCTSLTKIIIPSSIKTINDYSFAGCSSLTSIHIPSSVSSIGNYSFADCSSLTQITIPSSVKKIGEYSFYRCKSLINIDLQSSITEIGKSSFANCFSLIKIIIPPSITSIKSDMFVNCSSLIDIDLNSSIESIEDRAFYGCSSLTSIIIPSSCMDIGDSIFTNCYSLTDVIIPSNINEICYATFANCKSLTKIDIPSSVTSIGIRAFDGCSSLVQINIPSSVTKIEYGAFAHCSSLIYIDIPSSISFIDRYSFCECLSLQKIKIPSSVKSIDENAFYKCPSISQKMFPSSAKIIKSDQLSYMGNIKPNLIKTSSGVYYSIEELSNLMASNKKPICVITGKQLTEKRENFYPYLVDPP